MNDQTNGNPHPSGPPEPESVPIIILDDAYNTALLGNSVSPLEPPRAVYSLPLLCTLEMRRTGKEEEEAQKSIISMMRSIYKEHGVGAPIFVDDSTRRNPPKNKSKIIVPGRFGR